MYRLNSFDDKEYIRFDNAESAINWFCAKHNHNCAFCPMGSYNSSCKDRTSEENITLLECNELLEVVDMSVAHSAQWLVKKLPTGKEYTVCSHCNTNIAYRLDNGAIENQYFNTNYCPICGAKMDGAING